MSSFKKFLEDAAFVGLAQLAIRAGGLISLPVFTKIYGAELYGLWVQILLITTLLTPILALRLETACVRFLSSVTDKKQLAAHFYAILLVVAVSGIVFLICGYAFNKSLSRLLFAGEDYYRYLNGAFIWLFIKCLMSICSVYFRISHRLKTFAIFNLTSAWSEIGLIYIGAFINLDLIEILAASIIKDFIFSTIMLAIITNETGNHRPDFRPLKEYLAYSIPLLPNTALLWVVNASDRFLINRFIDLSASGVYSVSYSISSIIILLYAPLTLALFPAVSKFWEQGNVPLARQYFEYTLKVFLVLAIPCAAGLWVICKPLLSLLASPEFYLSANLVLVHSVGICLLGVYQITLYGIHLARKTKFLTALFLLAAIVNFAVNLYLIPRIGIMGAGISTLLAYFLLAGIVSSWSRKEMSFGINWLFILKCILASIFMVTGLRYLPVLPDAGQIVITFLAGIILYFVGLLFLKAFNQEERKYLLSNLKNLILREKNNDKNN